MWEHVEQREVVTAAATVDGGELAWQLTQVSAGLKICDSRAINPLTGQRLFGESGYDRVQSRYVCFPLHVHIAKDNKEFYAMHLQQFFNELNEMEDRYGGGLQFTHGAEMCSLIKMVKRGGAMKKKVMHAIAATSTGMIWQSQTLFVALIVRSKVSTPLVIIKICQMKH